MLLGSYQLIWIDPASFFRLAVLVLFSLLLAVTVHGFSQALLANGLGDSTARYLGRLSLNPIRHLAPSGSIMLLAAGFGWGKSVPVNQEQLPLGRLGAAMVAASGPLSNLVIAFLLAVPIKAGLLSWSGPSLSRATYVMSGGLREGISDILGIIIFMNILFAVFNLIPLAPLDGSKLVRVLLTGGLTSDYARWEKYGPLILVGLIVSDYFFDSNILWTLLGPSVTGLTTAATGF